MNQIRILNSRDEMLNTFGSKKSQASTIYQNMRSLDKKKMQTIQTNHEENAYS